MSWKKNSLSCETCGSISDHPFDCEGQFDVVAPCSKPCGGGRMVLVYTITSHRTTNGTACPYDAGDTISALCNSQRCCICRLLAEDFLFICLFVVCLFVCLFVVLSSQKETVLRVSAVPASSCPSARIPSLYSDVGLRAPLATIFNPFNAM